MGYPLFFGPFLSCLLVSLPCGITLYSPSPTQGGCMYKIKRFIYGRVNACCSVFFSLRRILVYLEVAWRLGERLFMVRETSLQLIPQSLDLASRDLFNRDDF